MMHSTFKGEMILATVLLVVFILGTSVLIPGLWAARGGGGGSNVELTITSPASGSSFNLGTAFPVVISVKCLSKGQCKNVTTTISFSPTTGLYLPSDQAIKTLGNIPPQSSVSTQWTVNSNAAGTYMITVFIQSSAGTGRAKSINVTIISAPPLNASRLFADIISPASGSAVKVGDMLYVVAKISCVGGELPCEKPLAFLTGVGNLIGPGGTPPTALLPNNDFVHSLPDIGVGSSTTTSWNVVYVADGIFPLRVMPSRIGGPGSESAGKSTSLTVTHKFALPYCLDQDAENHYFQGYALGIIESGASLNNIKAQDYCTTGSSILNEWICSSPTSVPASSYTCPGTCLNGICVDVPIPASSTQCDDSDGGMNYNVKGTVIARGTYPSGSPIVRTDSCFDIDGVSKGLYEWTCEWPLANYTSATMYVCPGSCVDGACVP